MIAHPRTVPPATLDARARRTRRRLAETYLQAVDDSRAEISVVDLCKLAGVGRSTFYAHFATIEDLVVWMISDVFREMAPIDVERRSAHVLERSEITRLGAEQLIERLWSTRSLLVSAIQLPAGPAIQMRLVAEVAETTRGTVLAEQPQMTEAEVDLATNFVAAGIVQLVLTWLSAPVMTRDQVLENLLGLLPTWMS